MDVSVIIITKNQLSFLRRTIPILLRQNFSGTYEIIVVDSGSTDGALRFCRSQPIKLITLLPREFSYPHAFNVGAKQAKGKYLVRLSGDAIPLDQNWLHHLISPLQDPKTGAAYGKYVVKDHVNYEYPSIWGRHSFPNRAIRHHLDRHWGLGISSSFTNFYHTYSLAGGNCAIRQDLWRARPFNESIPANEDAEYAWFLHTIGYDVVYTPKAKVLHQHPKTPASVKLRNHLRCCLNAVRAYFQIIRFWITGEHRQFLP